MCERTSRTDWGDEAVRGWGPRNEGEKSWVGGSRRLKRRLIGSKTNWLTSLDGHRHRLEFSLWNALTQVPWFLPVYGMSAACRRIHDIQSLQRSQRISFIAFRKAFFNFWTFCNSWIQFYLEVLVILFKNHAKFFCDFIRSSFILLNMLSIRINRISLIVSDVYFWLFELFTEIPVIFLLISQKKIAKISCKI